MKIKVEQRSNRIVVLCVGKLDAVSGPELEKQVKKLFTGRKQGNSLLVNLDLSHVDYISSAGVRSLMVLYNETRKMASDTGDVKMRIMKPSANVSDVLKIVGILDELSGLRRKKSKSQKSEQSKTDFRYLMDDIRDAFPAPVSDAKKDEEFVSVISKGLDMLDGLKSERPYLGKREKLNYDKARSTKMPELKSSIEESVADMAHYMEGLPIWGHPKTQVNVIPPSSIPSILGHLFASIHNPNIIWDELSHSVAQAEVELVSMCADLVGYDSKKSAGISTFGGTGTTFYGIKIGLEKAQPGAFKNGVRQDLKVLSSDASHYAKYSALGWLGLGTKNLVTVATDQDNAMGLVELENELRKLLDNGERIACIIATMGTTDAFGVDNLEFIVHLRDRLVKEYELDYKPHVHADAVIGWAWSVFNDYDFDSNPMQFPPRTLRSLSDASIGLRTLALADSIGFDFHKTGYAPYISSLFLCKDVTDLNLISRELESMPYLFQWGNYHPGVFTLETSRSGGSVLAAWANLKFFGKEGYRALLGHIVTIAESLRKRIEESSFVTTVNDYNYGPVTLFRVYPEGVDAHQAYIAESTGTDTQEMLIKNNTYNRKIFDVLHKHMEEGDGLALSVTDCYRTAANGEPILALKSFVMTPFADEEAMDGLMKSLDKARSEV